MKLHLVLGLSDLPFFLFVFTLIFLFRAFVSYKYPDVPKNTVTLSFLMHLLFSILFILMFRSQPADSYTYWIESRNAADAMHFFKTGTPFINLIAYPFSNIMRLSFISCFFVFGTLGFIGIFYFYLTLWQRFSTHRSVRPYLNAFLFIPGLHFWTSAIGKDSVTIFGVGLLTYWLQDFRKNFFRCCAAIIFIGIARPHIGLLLLISLSMAIIFSSKTPFRAKVVLISLATIGIVSVGTYLVQTFVQQGDIATISQFIESREKVFQGTGSFVDLAGKSPPEKIFAFLFRPFIFEARSPLQLLAGLENIFFVGLFAFLFRPKTLTYLAKKDDFLYRFHFFYFIGGSTLLGLMIYNLGLASRQKMMVIPSFIMIFITLFVHLKERKCSSEKSSGSTTQKSA